MQTLWSAKRTWSELASAVEWTATVLMPISLQARMTRSAISPRLAISIFLNTRTPHGEKSGFRISKFESALCRFYHEERLAVFHGLSVFHQDLNDLAR